MESDAPYITNLVNSIIGVSVLAMPFCMKKCGLLLGLGLLIGMAWITYISCNMLITAAVIKRRRTYEYLAFYTVGPKGKFLVELSMIGLMLGTCTAFYVIIGDLATAILQEQVKAEPNQLRTFVILFCGLCIALPLGLMKNISVLGFIGLISLAFYCLFVCVMTANSISRGLLTFSWVNKIDLFKPSGVFQCLPIFSLAYACQCQLFLVYDSLEDASVARMEKIVARSLKIVTFVYCTVAILGYATYIDSVEGNVLKNFSPNLILDFVKLGFAVSVVVGFPLMIFPCRQSIHTLFFSQHPTDGVASKTYIEPFMFKAITLSIVLATMMVALFIPNVETILGLTGATMGSFICFIFPGVIFTKASPKEDTGISKFVLGIGCLLLVLCTYSNVVPPVKPDNAIVIQQKPPLVVDIKELNGIAPKLPNADDVGEKLPIANKPPIAPVIDTDHRHEPANPIEPVLPNNVAEENNKDLGVQEDANHKDQVLSEDKVPIDKDSQPNAEKSPDKQKHEKLESVVEKKPEQNQENLQVRKDIPVELEIPNNIDSDVQSKDQGEHIEGRSIINDPKKDTDSLKSEVDENKKVEEKKIADNQPENSHLNKDSKSIDEKSIDNPGSIDAEKLLNKIKLHQQQQHELLHAEEALIKALEKKQKVENPEDKQKQLEENKKVNSQNVVPVNEVEKVAETAKKNPDPVAVNKEDNLQQHKPVVNDQKLPAQVENIPKQVENVKPKDELKLIKKDAPLPKQNDQPLQRDVREAEDSSKNSQNVKSDKNLDAAKPSVLKDSVQNNVKDIKPADSHDSKLSNQQKDINQPEIEAHDKSEQKKADSNEQLANKEGEKLPNSRDLKSI